MSVFKKILKSDTPDPSQIGTSSYYKGEGIAHEDQTGLGSTSTETGTRVTGGDATGAVGETTTYSSSRLPPGDPTSSVVDSTSTDPLTYKRPEAGAHPPGADVGEGAATSTTGLISSQPEESKRDLPGHENPYKTTHLDPRVDGLPKDSAPTSTGDYSTGKGTGTDTGTGIASGAGAGQVGTGVASAYGSSKPEETTTAPSGLTSTTDPVDRSAEYGTHTHTRGIDEADTVSSTLPDRTAATTGTASTTELTGSTTTAAETEQPSIVSRALGAVGLGGLIGGYAAGTASSGDHTTAAETPDQPTTTTGIDSYTAPTEQGPPGHHRKESIPTTAYPSGTFDSVRAINPPIGSAGSPVVHGDRDRKASRDIGGTTSGGLAGAATGAAVAMALGSTGHEDSRHLGSTTEDSSGHLAFAHHATTVGEPGDTTTATRVGGYGVGTTPTTGTTSGEYGVGTTSHGHGLGTASDSTYTAPTTTTTTTTTTTSTATKDRDHTARDAAIGAGAGAAAAYGTHEYSKKEAEKAEEEAASRERAAREKEEAHHRKELEKQHKAEEKAAHKEEKHHQKELKKEEKAAALHERREHEAEEQRLRKQREEEAEERRIREQKDSLTGAAYADEREKEKEKKPSIFKRIFKRRKNKDTGEEEEYSSDEAPHQIEPEAKAAYGATLVSSDHTTYGETKRRMSREVIDAGPTGTGYGQTSGAGVASADRPHIEPEAKAAYGATLVSSDHTTYGETKRRLSREGIDAGPTGTGYRRTSGAGVDVSDKPSRDPLHKDETPTTTSATGDAGTIGATTAAAAATGAAGLGDTGTQHRDPITGLAYDPSKDPEAARRLSSRTHGDSMGIYDKRDAAAAKEEGANPLAVGTATSTGGYGQDTSTTGHSAAPATLESTGAHTQQPTGEVAGLPYDSSKDTPTTGHTGGQTYGSNTATGTTTGEYVPNTDFTLGEVVGKHAE